MLRITLAVLHLVGFATGIFAVLSRGAAPETVADPARAGRIATISFVQASLVVLMVIAATAM